MKKTVEELKTYLKGFDELNNELNYMRSESSIFSGLEEKLGISILVGFVLCIGSFLIPKLSYLTSFISLGIDIVMLLILAKTELVKTIAKNFTHYKKQIIEDKILCAEIEKKIQLHNGEFIEFINKEKKSIFQYFAERRDKLDNKVSKDILEKLEEIDGLSVSIIGAIDEQPGWAAIKIIELYNKPLIKDNVSPFNEYLNDTLEVPNTKVFHHYL